MTRALNARLVGIAGDLETCTAPDREIDLAIWWEFEGSVDAFFADDFEQAMHDDPVLAMNTANPLWRADTTSIPPYTASFDAVLDLVEAHGHPLRCERRHRHNGPAAWIVWEPFGRIGHRAPIDGRTECIALLQAFIQMKAAWTGRTLADKVDIANDCRPFLEEVLTSFREGDCITTVEKARRELQDANEAMLRKLAGEAAPASPATGETGLTPHGNAMRKARAGLFSTPDSGGANWVRRSFIDPVKEELGVPFTPKQPAQDAPPDPGPAAFDRMRETRPATARRWVEANRILAEHFTRPGARPCRWADLRIAEALGWTHCAGVQDDGGGMISLFAGMPPWQFSEDAIPEFTRRPELIFQNLTSGREDAA
jgi:hypothetical protein